MPDKWLIAGTGPTLHIPPGAWKVVAVNRAIPVFDHVDVWFVSHRTCMESMFPYIDRIDKVITGKRICMDYGKGIDVYATDRSVFPPLFDVCGDKLQLYQIIERLPESVGQVLSDPPNVLRGKGTTACSALCWLRKRGVTEFWSVGIDGGEGHHPSLTEAYQNLPAWRDTNYAIEYACFEKSVKSLGLTWHKIGSPEERDA